MYKGLSGSLRGLTIDAVEASQSGHPGAPMGMADIATVLYANHLKFLASQPHWPDRDRVVLSNGHASLLLYALMYVTGYKAMTLDEIRNFRQQNSLTPGHPEYGHTPGVEATTGPLGQGIGMAVGMALAESRLREEFGRELCDHRTWVFAGDGCLMEGVGQEAASLAGHLGLGRLNLLYDMNGISIDGSTDLSFTEDTGQKFRALGWHVQEADGHDYQQIDDALSLASEIIDRPSIILFKTTIGFGSPSKAGSAKSHGAPLGQQDAAGAKEALGLPGEPFALDAQSLTLWREIGKQGKKNCRDWQTRVQLSDPGLTAEFTRRIKGDLPESFNDAVKTGLLAAITKPAALAIRKASQLALERLSEAVPELIGGSADLTGSNLTRTSATAQAFSKMTTGRYVNYGVREFAMAAAMNGMAVHGGVIPYGGTFFVFSDYMRNAIRLSAMMGIRVVYVMTHDSIGLGEDGPTHQPIEHLASFRAMPNINVFRPAETVETLEVWQLALASTNRPSLIVLSRQSVPQLRLTSHDENLSEKGAYVISEVVDDRDITLLATGTEVSLAVEAAQTLKEQGIKATVVSMPCWELFDAQSSVYRDAVLGSCPRLAIEAASAFGWTRYVASEEHVIGINEFGASAPAESLYKQYGITRDTIVRRALQLVKYTSLNH